MMRREFYTIVYFRVCATNSSTPTWYRLCCRQCLPLLRRCLIRNLSHSLCRLYCAFSPFVNLSMYVSVGMNHVRTRTCPHYAFCSFLDYVGFTTKHGATASQNAGQRHSKSPPTYALSCPGEQSSSSAGADAGDSTHFRRTH